MADRQSETSNAERIDALLAALPARLRSLRGNRLTRTRLAQATGLDVGTLKRIERSQIPTLRQLLRISAALSISPWEALGDVRFGQPRQTTRTGTTPYGAWQLVSEDAAMHDPIEHELPGDSSDRPCRHDGTEWLYVVTGTVQLTLGLADMVIDLGPRDVIDFDASQTHRIHNTGDDGAVVLRRMSRAGLDAHLPDRFVTWSPAAP